MQARDDMVRERLLAFVAEWTRRPRAFEWGRSNCCHFGSDWVEAVEGWRPISW